MTSKRRGITRWWNRFVRRWQESTYERRGLLVLGADDVERDRRQPVEASQPMFGASRTAQLRQREREER